MANQNFAKMVGFSSAGFICSHCSEPVYSGQLGTSLKCPDHHGVLIFQVSLHVNGYFGTITKCPDYGRVLIFKCPY